MENYTHVYDAENPPSTFPRDMMVSVSGGSATATFYYDGDGNRMKGTIGGVTTTYIGGYFEWTGSTSTMKSYYYAGGTRVVMRTGTSMINYLLGDHLGSTSITANSSGVVDKRKNAPLLPPPSHRSHNAFAILSKKRLRGGIKNKLPVGDGEVHQRKYADAVPVHQ